MPEALALYEHAPKALVANLPSSGDPTAYFDAQRAN